jgi:hypothetical protein
MALKIKIPTQIWKKKKFALRYISPPPWFTPLSVQTLYGKVGSNIFLHRKKKRKERKEKEKKETHRLHWKPDETLSRSFERQKTTIYFSFELLASFPLREWFAFVGGLLLCFSVSGKNNPVKSRGKKVVRHLDKSTQFGSCSSFLFITSC